MSFRKALHSLWDPTAELLAQAAETQETPEKPDAFLRQLQIHIHRRLGSPYPGEFRGAFKGHGMDLHGLRQYQPGDEVRKIDWNVLARTGVLHVKEHYEEKQIPVWFFVDATASMHFGQQKTKLAYVRQLVGSLGLLALEAGHRVGLVLWQGEKKPVFIKPQPTMVQLQWILRTLEEAEQTEGLSPQGEFFPDLAALLQNRCLVFLLSDFTFLQSVPNAMQTLTRLSPKHQVHSLLVVDPVEENLISGHGWLPVFQRGDEGIIWLNTSDKAMVAEYREAFQQQLQKRLHLLASCSRACKASTDEDPMEIIVPLMRAS